MLLVEMWGSKKSLSRVCRPACRRDTRPSCMGPPSRRGFNQLNRWEGFQDWYKITHTHARTPTHPSPKKDQQHWKSGFPPSFKLSLSKALVLKGHFRPLLSRAEWLAGTNQWYQSNPKSAFCFFLNIFTNKKSEFELRLNRREKKLDLVSRLLWVESE